GRIARRHYAAAGGNHMIRPALLAAAFVVFVPAIAFAHGGSYSGPGAQPGGGPSSGPQVPPGTSDPQAPTTRWESWWAANKELFLNLAEEMRAEDGPTSRGLGGGPPRSST